MRDKAVNRIWTAVCAAAGLLLALSLAFTGIECVAFDSNRYEGAYARLHTAEINGIEHEELMGITRQVLDYLRGDYPDLYRTSVINGEKRSTFREREILHMMDVQDLFLSGYFLRYAALGTAVILIGLCFLSRRGKALDMVLLGYEIGVGIFLTACLIFGIMVLVDFDTTFVQFHLLFFHNDMWLLSSQDMLIRMFPEQFFYEMAISIVLYMMLFIIVPAIGAGIVQKLRKRRVNHG